jgi:hypothetical protein
VAVLIVATLKLVNFCALELVIFVALLKLVTFGFVLKVLLLCFFGTGYFRSCFGTECFLRS